MASKTVPGWCQRNAGAPAGDNKRTHATEARHAAVNNSTATVHWDSVALIQSYREFLRSTGLSASTVRKHEATARRFANWIEATTKHPTTLHLSNLQDLSRRFKGSDFGDNRDDFIVRKFCHHIRKLFSGANPPQGKKKARDDAARTLVHHEQTTSTGGKMLPSTHHPTVSPDISPESDANAAGTAVVPHDSWDVTPGQPVAAFATDGRNISPSQSPPSPPLAGHNPPAVPVMHVVSDAAALYASDDSGHFAASPAMLQALIDDYASRPSLLRRTSFSFIPAPAHTDEQQPTTPDSAAGSARYTVFEHTTALSASKQTEHFCDSAIPAAVEADACRPPSLPPHSQSSQPLSPTQSLDSPQQANFASRQQHSQGDASPITGTSAAGHSPHMSHSRFAKTRCEPGASAEQIQQTYAMQTAGAQGADPPRFANKPEHRPHQQYTASAPLLYPQPDDIRDEVERLTYHELAVLANKITKLSSALHFAHQTCKISEDARTT
ncbi:hypothetical protein RI367_008169 [Sorochytrium milnesiophthora]